MPNIKKDDDKFNLKKAVELLKFAVSLDDEEVIKATIESVIEILEEEINE